MAFDPDGSKWAAELLEVELDNGDKIRIIRHFCASTLSAGVALDS